MSTTAPTEDRVSALEAKLNRIEAVLETLLDASIFPVPREVGMDEPGEVAVPPYVHLVRRPRSWRRQLFLKGRNMTVRQMVGTMKASRMSEEETAEDLCLPVEAVREALGYYAENKELLELESAIERYVGSQGRKPHGTQPVP